MNFLNLIGATLLTVSPILNEPKNVIRPDNVIMEKVEYLDNNIIATSYIYQVENDNYFYLNFNDGKDINLDYTIKSTYYNDLYERELAFEFGDGESTTVFSPGSYDELVTYGNLSTNDYKFHIYLIDSDTVLTVDYYSELYEDLEVTINDANLVSVISSEYLNYYQNEDLNFTYDLSSNNLFTYYMSKYFFLKESSPITDNIFDIVGGTVENYLTTITTLFSRVISLFYVNNKLTILGVLMVFTFGIGIVKFGFNLIKDLLRL